MKEDTVSKHMKDQLQKAVGAVSKQCDLLKEQLTFTQLGDLLDCSRQNIKKLADVLMKKGFITIRQSPHDTRAMCILSSEKVNDYFQNDFWEYQEKLKYLFEVYTDKEIETLFILLSKLYAGIDNLEKRVTDGNNSNI